MIVKGIEYFFVVYYPELRLQHYRSEIYYTSNWFNFHNNIKIEHKKLFEIIILLRYT